MLHMLGVDIGHDGNGRGQTVEGAVGFIRLDHHPFALPHPCVRPVSMDDPAVHNRRIDPTVDQQFGHHRRCGGLAVGSRHRNVGFQAHQLCQHLGAAHDGKARHPCGIQFRVARLDRRRDHDHGGPFDIRGLLPFEHRRAKVHQTVGDLGRFQVRSLHAVTVVQQHLGNAGHADTANTHEMDRAHIGGEFRGCVHRFFPSVARVSTIWASSSAASGLATDRAARAICCAPSAWVSTISI